MKKNLTLIFLLAYFFLGTLYSQKTRSFNIQSPDQQIDLKVTVGDIIEYSVNFKNEQILLPSGISMTIDEGFILGSKPSIASVKNQSFDEMENVLFGKFNQIQNKYKQLRINFKNNYALEFRVYDNGVAYRFITSFKNNIMVSNERSDYNFHLDPEIYVAFAKSYTAHYEELYEHMLLSEVEDKKLCLTPLIISYPDKLKIVLTESDILDYPGMYLEKDKQNERTTLTGNWARYPLEVEKSRPSYTINKRADYIAKTVGSRTFPWRIMIIEEKEQDLITNELVYLLAEKSRLNDVSWIKPGKVAWDWWYARNLSGVDFETGMNTRTYEYYIDFASQNKLEYIIIDGGWSDRDDFSKLRLEMDIPYLSSYAAKRNVGVILWVANNTLTEDLERNLDILQSYGAAGLKVDFIERDDQEGVKFFEDIAKAAAKRKMILLFHGCSKPAGIQRTYPNILNFEAVLGAEFSKWSDLASPDHHVMIPFTRMLSGPLDCTPGAMRNASKENFRIISSEPMGQGTRCHDFSMYVVYDSPLVMLSDAPTSYERDPASLDFLAGVPFTWDTTIVLNGRIGEFILLAKAKGETWYVGAMNNWTEREIIIDFNFLPGINYNASVYSDGLNANKVASDYKFEEIKLQRDSKLKVKLASGGGAVIKLVPDN